MDEYEKWENNCKRTRKQNEKLLSEFVNWLKKAGIKESTIDKHYRNVDFYINEFLLYEDAIPANKGSHLISMFLGYWFIKKAMWANVPAIKNNAASLKKFYQFMLEKGKIDNTDFEELKQIIKEEMPQWLSTMERYDDPDIEDMGEVWGL